MTSEIANRLLTEYHNFDDGLVLSFGFFYPASGKLSAQGVFYAKNHSAPGDRWDTIRVVIRDVVDFNVQWKGNQVHSICAGVHILKLEGLWCIDVDGVYGEAEDPKSIEEVRGFGDCYATGHELEVFIGPDCRVDLHDLTIFPGAPYL